MGENSQPICGNYGLVGEIKWCEVQRETRDFAEKCVKVTVVTREVEGGEVCEPSEDTFGYSWSIESEREADTIRYREKLFRDDRERIQDAAVVIVG